MEPAHMSNTLIKGPSRGRLFKLFTDFGPYFRHLQSDEKSFFFDCLEICVNDKEELEDRTFIGWWMVAERTENKFSYQRFNGLYDIEGNWVDTKITAKQQQQLDQSFELFIEKLTEMLDVETGCEISKA